MYTSLSLVTNLSRVFCILSWQCSVCPGDLQVDEFLKLSITKYSTKEILCRRSTVPDRVTVRHNDELRTEEEKPVEQTLGHPGRDTSLGHVIRER